MNTVLFRIFGVMTLALGIVGSFFSNRFDEATRATLLVTFCALGLGLVTLSLIPTLTRRRNRRASRKRCERAFEKLWRWTLSTPISSKNYGYHKQLTAELDNALYRHLHEYPKEGRRKMVKGYLKYLERSYKFGIKK